ncbi:MAG: serine protease [Bacteroidia bacterium]
MGLPLDILNFFNVSNAKIGINGGVPHTVSEFVSGRTDIDYLEVSRICKRFENEGLLVYCGNKTETPLTGDSYYNFGINKKLAADGSYDFLINGFLSIRNHFANSVRPVIVKKRDDDPTIGTCFVIGKNCIVTAFHCIEEMEYIKIPHSEDNYVKAKRIWTPNDIRKDIAFIELENAPFSDIPHFKIGRGEILDQVLTMGYPQVPVFDAIQLAEIVTINTTIKSSTGSIVGKDKSYLDGQEYFLINAKVKGGNSGGPIIDKLGRVVGMLIQIPADPDDNKKLDVLGYGIAIPGVEIVKIFRQIIDGDNAEIKNIKFQNLTEGFSTL